MFIVGTEMVALATESAMVLKDYRTQVDSSLGLFGPIPMATGGSWENV